MQRNQYIDNIDVEQAKELYFQKLEIEASVEKIDVAESLNRIVYKAIYAKTSSPTYNAAAMDGIAVKSKDTVTAKESKPLPLKENVDYIYVNTGNPINEPYDSVIMIEDVMKKTDGQVEILAPSYPYQHVRQIGEDIVATEMILPSKHKIRPMDMGALISGGIEHVEVYKKPLVGIIPTGSEIVETISQVCEGKIIDSNSHVFKGLVETMGGEAKRYKPTEDDYERLKSIIQEAVRDNDIVLINAGSSAGTKDYTVDLIKELGQVFVHGVAMKPGKPTILGIIDGKPVIGIPGYPVSGFMVFDVFIKPLIHKYLGSQDEINQTETATLSRRVVSSLKNKELIRVNLGFVDNRLIATPLAGGAGVSMSLVRADALGIIPRNVEGYEAGDKIRVELLKPLSKIKDTLVSIGSHDLVMDIMSDIMKLSSSHVGSMGGIMAIKRGEAHLAPIHLLDSETGEYNISYIQKYFPDQKMILIKGIQRKQGFMVEKTNPENIKGCKDLIRQGVSFANRQRGAGTRVLLDYQLQKQGIEAYDILGYKRELTTHMAVAAAVKSGSATTGLGILSAAKAMDLDFVPLSDEDYDFLIKEELYESQMIKDFIELIKSKEFQTRVKELGGYGFHKTGEIIRIGE